MTRPVLEEHAVDCTHTSEIVCPWCGHEFSNSYEFGSDTDDLICDECDNDLEYERDITVTYTTYRKGIK